MSSSNTLSVLLQQLLYAVPIVIVYAIALTLGIVNLNRAPRAAWLAIGASLTLIISNLMFLVVRVFLFSNPNRVSGPAFGQTLQIVGLVDMLIDVAGLLILVIAIFVDRQAAATTYTAGFANPLGANIPPGFPPPPAR